MTVLLLLFQFRFFFYFFFFSDSKLCWIKLAIVDILVLFLILEEMLSAFHHWVWCQQYVCHIWPLLCWGWFPLCSLSGELLSYICVEFSQKLFLHLLRWSCFLFLNLLMWCITLIDLQILSNPYIPGINLTWLWCMILLMYCWIWFASNFWGFFLSMFISDIGL